MPIDTLPADQRAVLQLLVRKGHTYAEIAEMLSLPEDAVRDRARGACEALVPDRESRVPGARRGEIADFLLGQQPVSKREATRTELAESAEARAWAIAVAAELRALDGAQRGAPAPERPARAPDESAPAEPDAAAETAAEEGELASGTVPAAVRGPARPAPRLGEDYAWPADGERERAARPSSRLGGWLLLGGLGLIVAVAAIWGITQLSSDDGNTTTSGAGTTTQATTPTTTTPSTTSSGDASGDQVVLRPADSASAAAGLAQVFRTNGKLSLGVVGEGLEPSPRYVIWLYNSRSDARFRGFAPKGVGKNGRLRGLVPNLGTNPGRFRSIVVTLEQTSQEPARPGKIVLRGPLKLPS